MENQNYVFIDADSILYRAAYAAKSDKQVRDRYRKRLDYIKVHTFSEDLFVAVKGADNFREKLDPEYKAQRKPLEEELKRRLIMCHEYAKELGAVQCDGWEADDQVRAWAWEAEESDIPWVIAGIDKDLLQIPGVHFNYGGSEAKPLSEDEKWKEISQEEGDFRFAKQLLTGDTVDNIKGIYRVGEKKATQALEGKNRKQMMEIIVQMYKDQFEADWERKLNVNCNLIYMRRWLDDEFDYKVWLNG